LTTLSSLRPGSRVNFERSLRAGDRLSGHVVRGVVEGVGRVEAVRQDGDAAIVTYSAPRNILDALIERGPVCVDGISLTVIAKDARTFSVSIVRFTADHTTVLEKQVGHFVNLESDVLARYAARVGVAEHDGSPPTRLPDRAHTALPWRIHDIIRDFRLEDVWALPTPGGPDDFPQLVQLMSSDHPPRGSARAAAARALWAIRFKVGKLLGWDGPGGGLGSRVPTLRDRLPVDLRDGPSGPDFDALPFSSLYLLDDEWAAEIANRTMHGVMHVGWVPDGTGGYRGQMAVYVKPNGLFGTTYMAAIRPFRHLIVYPVMLRQIDQEWQARGFEPTAARRG
jgi:hypothetical protein